MRFFSILVCVVLLSPQIALAGGIEVPGVGSEWISTSLYSSVAENGGPGRTEKETVTVDRMQDGRPVFAGRMNGFDGEILESTKGTIVYALECKNDVPASMLLPPASPNQCIGHVCRAPSVGDEPFVRATFIFVPLFGCQAQEGEYTFISLRVEGEGDNTVTVGDATFTLNGSLRAAWKSHIKKGEGQVFAESVEKVTTYDTVIVHLVPYLADKIGDGTAVVFIPAR